jgi:hypothetical protein
MSLVMYETYWDRADVVEAGHYHHVGQCPDALVRLPQLLVREQVLEALRTRLDAWLASPRPAPVDRELADVSRDQSLLFRLHDLRGALVLPRHFVDIKYRGHQSTSWVRVPVDQTCVQILRDDLDGLLSRRRPCP